MRSKAKSLSGLKGNIKFIVLHKTYATLVVFAVGFLLGAVVF